MSGTRICTCTGASIRVPHSFVKNGYKGYYCFEWEKAWHPEIEDPDVAFPQYADVMRGYLRDAGVKPGSHPV